MLEREEAPGAPDPRLHLVAHEQRAGLAAEALARLQVVRRRQVHALALHRLDHKAATSPPRERALERLQVAERDRLAVLQQRAEASAELLVAVERERAQREAMERVLGVEHPPAAGRRAGDLDRRLDRLGAAVGRAPSPRRSPARARAAPRPARRSAASHPAGAGCPSARRHHLPQRRDHLRVVAPDREHAIAAEQVEVALAPGRRSGARPRRPPTPVEAERAQDPPHLRVQVAVVELELLAPAGGEDLAIGGSARASTH